MSPLHHLQDQKESWTSVFYEDGFDIFGDNQQISNSYNTTVSSGVESDLILWPSLHQEGSPVEPFAHLNQSDYVIQNETGSNDFPVSHARTQGDSSDANTGSSDSVNMQQMDGSPIFTDDGVLPSLSPTHSYVQNGTPTSPKVIDAHIRQVDSNDGTRSYVCLYSGCTRSGTFSRKTEVVTHIRSVHLHEKPFGCSCGKLYAHKPDAMRHVRTKIGGRRYKCSVCSGAFERKDYRDHHEAQCLSSNSSPVSNGYL